MAFLIKKKKIMYWSQHNVFNLSTGPTSIILNSGEKNVVFWKGFPAVKFSGEHVLP